MTTVPLAVAKVEDRPDDSVTDHHARQTYREPTSNVGRLPELALVMAVGSALIAIAFAGARYSRPWAGHLYLLGQIVVYASPAAFLLLRKRVRAMEAVGIAVLMPVTTFLINQYYSPGQFRFLDEFEHVQTAQTILATHHLFQANTILPQSPQYPGLEIITTNIASITHLSITAAGLIVAGVAHVLVGVAFYFLVLEISARPRLAAVAVVVYATGSHYQFFDSYFIYETVAIPFLLLSLLATVKMMKSRGPVAIGWGGVAVACGAVTAVCHHVTSYALIGLLLAFVVGQMLLPSSARSRGVLVAFFAVLAIVGMWDLGVATSTFEYFRPVVSSLLHIPSLGGGGTTVKQKTGITGQPPYFQTLAVYGAFLILLALTLFGAWKVWFSRRAYTNGAAIGFGVASFSLFVVLVLRVVATNGSEISNRALTFILIPVSFVSALVLVDQSVFRRPVAKHRIDTRGPVRLTLVSTLVVVCLAVGGIASGWPTYYARLPGPYEVAAWERSVDYHTLDTAQWFAKYVPRDQGVASDYWTEGIVSALGYQAEPNNIAGLFLPTKYASAQNNVAKVNRVSFIVADTRITKQLPASGYLFEADPERGLYTTPLPAQSLAKFNDIPGVSRVYDDGTIVVYEIIGSQYLK